MADVKWIKITTDIFDDEKILLIENLPEADSIIVLWFKLLCLAGKQNNSGVFMMNDKLAYTDEMLATIFRRNVNTVRLALATFEQFGMIEMIDKVITIPKWEKHQSLDKLEAKKKYDKEYQARKRQEKKLLIENRTMSNDNRSLDIDKNRLEEDKNNSKAKRFKKPSVEEIETYCNERNNNINPNAFYDYYESKDWMIGKNRMKDWKAAIRTWERNNGGKNEKKGINITKFDV